MLVPCRGPNCNQKVRLIPTAASQGKRRIPIDPRPDRDRGNIALRRADEDAPLLAHVVAGEELHELREEGIDLYVSHFVTCVDAKRFRRRPRPGGRIEA